MNNTEFLKRMSDTGIIPVIKLEKTENAVQLAKALQAGGINAAEVTFRAAGADKVIADMVKACPDMLVGAGTVLTTEQVDAAIAAGAKFCVAPGLNPKVVKHCLDKGVPFCPGIANGSQIEQAIELGLDFVKFFPAEQAGGIKYVKAVSAPYSGMKFMPTGGINEDNLGDYLKNPKVVCCGGSWIVPDKLVKEEKWDEITALCKSAVRKMLNFSLAHVGINADEKSLETAQKFDDLFGWTVKDGNSSVFAGTFVECMKSGGRGKNGHIAVFTDSVSRAVYQLTGDGYEFDESTFKYDKDGRMTVAYMKNEIGGFAVHLVLRK